MSNLEMAVEALKRCVDPDAYEKALREVGATGEAKPISVTKEVCRILDELGMPTHIKGYRMAAYAVELAVRDEEILEVVTKGLYPAVAEKFHTTPSRAERAIRHAIETAWARGCLEAVDRYFGSSVSPSRGKPVNAEFIAKLANHIRLDADL